MAGAYPHKEGEKVFYVRRYSHVFFVKKKDANGKFLQRTNQVTGLPINNASGEPELIEQAVEFTRWKTRFTQDGYVSVFVVKPDTDKDIVAELEKDAKDRGSEIMDEKTFIKTVNPELAERMEQDEKTQKLLGEKDGKISTLLAEVEQLRKRLGGNKN
jgi:hypothetical protein